MNSEAIAHFFAAAAELSTSGRRTYSSCVESRSPDESFPNEVAAKTLEFHQTDEYLMCQVQSGSQQALSVIFRRHARTVLNVAKRILKDDGEAEDLVQEVFLFLFQKSTLFNPAKASGISWIIQITYHRAIDRRRHLNSRHHYDGVEFDEVTQQVAGKRISFDDLAARTLLSRLREELSPEQRQTLEFHFFDGYTFHEIAEKTGQTVGNVRHHYYRGLERLRSFVFPGKHL